jgi:hypothetical protein
MMRSRKILIGAGTLVALALAGGAGVALAGSADDGEEPITGPALEQASAAALAFTGGGRVTGTEVGDEESYYEVEVTLDDGTQVDVQLDERFVVVGSAADRDTGNDGTGDD